MSDQKKLPPLPDEAFDGEKYKTELTPITCTHKNVQIINNSLRCACGAGWQGPDIVTLYRLLKNQ